MTVTSQWCTIRSGTGCSAVLPRPQHPSISSKGTGASKSLVSRWPCWELQEGLQFFLICGIIRKDRQFAFTAPINVFEGHGAQINVVLPPRSPGLVGSAAFAELFQLLQLIVMQFLLDEVALPFNSHLDFTGYIRNYPGHKELHGEHHMLGRGSDLAGHNLPSIKDTNPSFPPTRSWCWYQ